MENQVTDAKLLSQPGRLFPIVTTDSFLSKPSMLFPVYSTSSSDHPGHVGNVVSTDLGLSREEKVEAPEKTDLSWLSNQSYRPNIAEQVEAEAARRDLQTKRHKRSKDKKHREEVEALSDDASDDERSRKRKKKKHKNKKVKHRHHSPDLASDTSASLKEPEQAALVKESVGKNFIEEIPGLEAADAFRLDRKSDPNNRVYDGLYKQHIARHHSVGHSCLGLLPKHEPLYFDRSTKHRKEELRTKRYFSKKNLKQHLLESETARPTKTEENNHVSESEQLSNFISVKDPSRCSVTVTETNPLGIYDSATEQYLQGKQAITIAVATDFVTPTHNPIQAKVEQLNKLLRQNPRDIESWIALVKLQDDITLSSTQKQSEKAAAEIKSAILKRAMENNPSSIPLKLFQLQVCQGLWDGDQLTKEWSQVVFVHANDVNLWKQYLFFMQSQFKKFTVSSLIKSYSKCFSTLQAIVDGTMKSHPCLPGTETEMIALFSQLCQCLCQAGHTEKAVSLYQAMLEVNICCPSSLKASPWKQRLQALEAFWDSSAPRVGEPGCQGFDQWVLSQEAKPSKPFSSKEKEEKIEEDLLHTLGQDQGKCWHALETSRMHWHWFPWKPDEEAGQTEEDCEDPERLVLFDDITSCLFAVSSPTDQFRLLHNFLEMLGIIQAGSSYRTAYESLRDCGIGGGYVNGCEAFSVDEEMLSYFLDNMLDVLKPRLESKHRKTLDVIRLKYRLHRVQANAKAGRKVKGQWKELRKYAKNLLKEEQNRNCLLLWETFAKIEHSAGNTEEAYRVLDTALAMFGQDALTSTEHDTVTEAYRLYRTYTELVIADGKIAGPSCHPASQDVVRVLCVLKSLALKEKYCPDQRAISPASELRVRKVFQERLDELIQRDADDREDEDELMIKYQGSQLLHLTVCFSWFQYLTVGVSAAGAVFQQVLSFRKRTPTKQQDSSSNLPQAFSAKRDLREILTECHIELLQHHLTSAVASLSLLRVPLQQALVEYPESSFFLHAFINMESKANIAGRLRAYFRKNAKPDSSPLVYLLAAYSELHRMASLKDFYSQGETMYNSFSGSRPGSETGISHYVRSWLERGSQHGQASHCILLWRMYIQFEIDQGNPNRAGSVLFRALHCCPWAKALYVDAVKHFPDQLSAMMDLMTEKEVRLRTPVEELELLMENIKEEGDITPDDGETPGVQLEN